MAPDPMLDIKILFALLTFGIGFGASMLYFLNKKESQKTGDVSKD